MQPESIPERVRLGGGGATSIRLPSVISLELARTLLDFLNARRGEKSFRLVIDEDGLMLERT